MSTLRVAAIKDLTGNTGFVLSATTVQTNNTLVIPGTLQIDGSITGSTNSILPSHSGQNGKMLWTNGTSPYWADPPSSDNISSMSVFTSSGTWNRPADVKYIKVQVIGGGGAGGGHGEGGGAGGYSEEVINVESISSVYCTISGESNGTYYRGGAGNGGSSSFGSYLSASGGYGANRNHQHCGGLGGVGSGGNLNIYGGGGDSHHGRSSVGGGGFWGGAVAGGHPQGGNFSHNHQSHSSPGSGGSGGYFHNHRGSNGRPGMIVITHFK